MKLTLILLTCLIGLFTWWYNKPAYIQENNCSIEDIVGDPKNMEKAINEMGPYYQYIIETDGTLRIKVDKEWLILKYSGRSLTKIKGKTHAEIIDFLDPYKYLAEHCIQRLALYKNNGWI